MLFNNYSWFKRTPLLLTALLLTVTGCYKLPMEEIKASHQYTAKQLIDEWRRHSARELSPVVHNDDYYAPYTPPVRTQNSQLASPSHPAYYYDPRVDNPQPYRRRTQPPYIAGNTNQGNGYYPGVTSGSAIVHDAFR